MSGFVSTLAVQMLCPSPKSSQIKYAIEIDTLLWAMSMRYTKSAISKAVTPDTYLMRPLRQSTTNKE